MTPLILLTLPLAGLGPWSSRPLPAELTPTPTQSEEADAKKVVDPDEASSVWEYLSGRYDANGDGKIDKKEYSRGDTQFARLDTDKNGFIEEKDSQQAGGRGRRGGGGRRGGERGERGGRDRSASAPTEGAAAIDFALETLYPVQTDDNGKADDEKAKAPEKDSEEKPEFKTVKLSSFEGKKHVALVFGSYT